MLSVFEDRRFNAEQQCGSSLALAKKRHTTQVVVWARKGVGGCHAARE